MARNTQTVELDLRAGATSNESGFAVGPRLRLTQNALWQPYASTDDLRRRILSMPQSVNPTPLFTLAAGTEYNPAAVLAVADCEEVLPAKAVITARETTNKHFLIYRGDNGALVQDTGQALGGQLDQAGSIAYWADIETPTVYMSHPELGKIYQQTSSGVSEYTAASGPGESYAGNPSIIIHLDRMWLAKNRRIWYTDPRDPTTIRPTNFVAFEDLVTTMFRASSSPVDAGAGTHLVTGLRKSVWVIDGDPTYGNAVQRRLVAGAGIAGDRCKCETAYGAVVVLTDGQFYLIPPGAQEIIPIGTPIRDQMRNFRYGELTISLEWMAPYVYAMFADLNVMWILDLSAGSNQTPKWWGPISSPTGPRKGRLFASTELFGEMLIAAPVDAHPLGIYPIMPTVSTASRQAKLVTGYLQQVGHTVELKKVVLESLRAPSPGIVRCTAHWSTGTRVTYGRYLPATTGSGGADIIGKTVFDFSVNPVISDFVWLELEWPTGVHPDLHRAYAEIRVQGRQDG